MRFNSDPILLAGAADNFNILDLKKTRNLVKQAIMEKRPLFLRDGVFTLQCTRTSGDYSEPLLTVSDGDLYLFGSGKGASKIKLVTSMEKYANSMFRILGGAGLFIDELTLEGPPPEDYHVDCDKDCSRRDQVTNGIYIESYRSSLITEFTTATNQIFIKISKNSGETEFANYIKSDISSGSWGKIKASRLRIGAQGGNEYCEDFSVIKYEYKPTTIAGNPDIIVATLDRKPSTNFKEGSSVTVISLDTKAEVIIKNSAMRYFDVGLKWNLGICSVQCIKTSFVDQISKCIITYDGNLVVRQCEFSIYRNRTDFIVLADDLKKCFNGKGEPLRSPDPSIDSKNTHRCLTTQHSANIDVAPGCDLLIQNSIFKRGSYALNTQYTTVSPSSSFIVQDSFFERGLQIAIMTSKSAFNTKGAMAIISGCTFHNQGTAVELKSNAARITKCTFFNGPDSGDPPGGPSIASRADIDEHIGKIEIISCNFQGINLASHIHVTKALKSGITIQDSRFSSTFGNAIEIGIDGTPILVEPELDICSCIFDHDARSCSVKINVANTTMSSAVVSCCKMHGGMGVVATGNLQLRMRNNDYHGEVKGGASSDESEKTIISYEM